MLFIRQKQTNSRVKKALLLLFGLYLMVGTSLYFIQEKILFLPTVLAQEYEFEFAHNFEELFFNTDEDAVINALHFKTEKPKGVILYFHGNAGDLSRWGKITEYFVDKNYDVLVMDYRTYGKSIGPLSESAFYHDAQFCYDYLKERYSEHQISVYGRSLGTAMATYVASNNKPKQLILETPYYSMTDVAQHRFPVFPTKYFLNYKFPTFEFIEKVSCPISMVHGTDDTVIPIKSANKLFEIVSYKNSSFITIQNGGHNSLLDFETYHKLIKRILP